MEMYTRNSASLILAKVIIYIIFHFMEQKITKYECISLTHRKEVPETCRFTYTLAFSHHFPQLEQLGWNSCSTSQQKVAKIPESIFQHHKLHTHHKQQIPILIQKKKNQHHNSLHPGIHGGVQYKVPFKRKCICHPRKQILLSF